MTSRDFVYWLQGYFEILDPSGTVDLPIGPVQVRVLREHLALVFKHETAPPPKYIDYAKIQQEAMTQAAGIYTPNVTGIWDAGLKVC